MHELNHIQTYHSLRISMRPISDFGVQVILIATVFPRLLFNIEIRRIFRKVMFIRIPNDP